MRLWHEKEINTMSFHHLDKKHTYLFLKKEKSPSLLLYPHPNLLNQNRERWDLLVQFPKAPEAVVILLGTLNQS